MSQNETQSEKQSNGLKLRWGFTFLVGLGFFATELIWRVYNSFVPIYLKSGDPVFDAAQTAPIHGFGLSATVTGVIMALDNVAALFLLPVIGALSDRTRTRIGRRMPFIVAFAPIAALAFALVPLAPSLIPAQANGQIGAMPGLFALFTLTLLLMLVAMACFRSPAVSLMPDLTPSPLRSKANGVINFMGGLAGVIGTVALAPLFDFSPWFPFVIGTVITLGAVALQFALVKETESSLVLDDALDEERQGLSILSKLREVPRQNWRNLGFLIAAIFFWFVAFNSIDTWFTSYGTTVLNLTPGTAGLLFSVALIAFILFAIPAGHIGTRFGRRRTIIAGLILFTVALIIINLQQNLVLTVILLILGGIGWALVNINSLPMVVDTSTDERLLGTYTGMYYIGSQMAAILGPVISGAAVDLAGGDFSTVFLISPFFFGLATLAMLFVTSGESKQVDARGRAIE